MTASVPELNFMVGATSGIQGQLNLKAPLASPTFTGVVVARYIVTKPQPIQTNASWNETSDSYTIPNCPNPQFGSAWNETSDSYTPIINY
jgi:hypothetical protein